MNTATTDVCTLQTWQHQPDKQNVSKGFLENLHYFEQRQTDLRTKQYLNRRGSNNFWIALLLDKETRHENWF